ncbi:MAG: thermonuclease family protein [Desulfobacterales bacterium]|nr:thermonuclease family protein [Desulfobacterales bacterium]
MKIRWACFVQLAFVLSLFSTGVAGAGELFKVKWVNDGDTIVLSDGRSVRYLGVDAPEIDHENNKAEPYGYKARRLNRDMVLGKSVRLEFDKEKFDRFGRLLAHVHLEDGTFVNGKMIEHGCATFLFKRPNIKRRDALLALQRKAIREGKGLWSTLADPEGKMYIGNKNSRRFHSETCEFGRKTGKKNRVLFYSKRDAFYEGFSPCGKCLKFRHKAE